MRMNERARTTHNKKQNMRNGIYQSSWYISRFASEFVPSCFFQSMSFIFVFYRTVYPRCWLCSLFRTVPSINRQMIYTQNKFMIYVLIQSVPFCQFVDAITRIFQVDSYRNLSALTNSEIYFIQRAVSIQDIYSEIGTRASSKNIGKV